MPTSRARVPTSNGSKYLQQLCKHWAHKFPVENTAERGHIDLGQGRLCAMQASGDLLTVEATTDDETGLSGLESVIADHIRRFAFREDLVFCWQAAA